MLVANRAASRFSGRNTSSSGRSGALPAAARPVRKSFSQIASLSMGWPKPQRSTSSVTGTINKV